MSQVFDGTYLMGCSLSYLATPLTLFLDDHSGGEEEGRIIRVQLPHPPLGFSMTKHTGLVNGTRCQG